MPPTKQTSRKSQSATKKSRATSARSSTQRAEIRGGGNGLPFNWPASKKAAKQVTAVDLDSDAPLAGQAYEDRYVAFIDILGFQELIKRSASKRAPKHANVASIFSALNVGGEGSSAASGDIRLHTFSDFVVISAPATDAGLVLIVLRVWIISRDWLSKRFLSRGGITRGQVLHRLAFGTSPAMVFGPAFVEAYHLESQVAEYPRVVLSKDVRRDWTHLWSRPSPHSITQQKLVRDCDDGPRCVDIFADIPINGFNLFGRDHVEEWAAFRRALLHHLDDAADTPAWYKKTYWLLCRFNAAVLAGSEPALYIKLAEEGAHS